MQPSFPHGDKNSNAPNYSWEAINSDCAWKNWNLESEPIKESAMPFTNHALDTYFSQGLSALTKCDVPDISGEFSQAASWPNNFILASIFTPVIEDKWKPHVFGILRKTKMAFVEYGDGRSALAEYLAGPKNAMSKYFLALYRFELAISMVAQAFAYIRKLSKENFYSTNDGSLLERLNRIYNVIKHLETSTLEEGQLHAVWLSNIGIHTATAQITWDELAQLLRSAGGVADTLADPKKLEEAMKNKGKRFDGSAR